MTIAGQDGWVNGLDRMNKLCNILYGNSRYASVTRNMKIEDVNRTLDYTSATPRATMTIGEKEKEMGTKLSKRLSPRLSITTFEDYLLNSYGYTGTSFKNETTKEYKAIFNTADGTKNQPSYWLSFTSVDADFTFGIAFFNLHSVTDGVVIPMRTFYSNGTEYSLSNALRPVIILKPNIQFGEKNEAGEWILVEM